MTDHRTPTASVTAQPADAPDTVQSTDVMSVLGFVFAFVAFPLGIVFSGLGLRNTRRDGTRGRGFAVAGMALSILVAVGFVLLLVLPASS